MRQWRCQFHAHSLKTQGAILSGPGPRGLVRLEFQKKASYFIDTFESHDNNVICGRKITMIVDVDTEEKWSSGMRLGMYSSTAVNSRSFQQAQFWLMLSSKKTQSQWSRIIRISDGPNKLSLRSILNMQKAHARKTGYLFGREMLI